MKIKLLQIIFFTFLSIFTIAQETIEINIIDKKTGNPVSFAHAKFDSITGAIFNENGKLLLNQDMQHKIHEIIISCIGYKSEKVIVDFSKEKQIIELDPIALELSEVVVKYNNPKWKQKTIGATKNNNNPLGFRYTPLSKVALLMETPYRENFLKSISFYIKDEQNPTEKFRAIVYSRDEQTGLPDKVLIEENIILSATKGNEWATCDISKFNITIPEEGIFVAMEWLLESRENGYVFHKFENGAEAYGTGQILGQYNVKKENNQKKVAITQLPNFDWCYYEDFWMCEGTNVISMPRIKCEILVNVEK